MMNALEETKEAVAALPPEELQEFLRWMQLRQAEMESERDRHLCEGKPLPHYLQT
jgi:hypothetical protein